jgi:outer membrane protein insertion porin family
MQLALPRPTRRARRAPAIALAAAAWLAFPAYGQEALPIPAAGPELVSPATDQPGEELVAEVRIVGNSNTSTAQIAGQITTRAGRRFDPTVVQKDVRKLATMGWFVDVKSLDEITPQGRIVTFQVVERPTIRWVEYLGNKGITEKKFAKETGLKDGGSVDPYAVEDGRRKLQELYASKGYNNAQITIMEGNKATDQGVTYLIHEGVSQRIWKVRFEGNSFVSDSRLKTLIKSKPPIMFLFKGYLDRERLDADVDVLTNYYRAYGFFQARIGRKIDYNEKGNWADVTFVIHEGAQSKIRNVQIVGNTKFEPEPLAEQIKVKSGDSFEQAKMMEAGQYLQNLYGARGYVFADVRPETVYLEQPGEVDVVYRIDEGKRFRVGRIFVHIGGDNPHTRIQTALNRMTIYPGEIMDIREVHASERRLLASSLFNVDAQTNQRPKITYRIPDDAELDFADDEPHRNVRGQSPENVGPPVLAPPSAGVLQAAAHTPAAAATDEMDMHVFCEDEAHYRLWEEAERQKLDPAVMEERRSRGEPVVQPGDAPAPAAPSADAPIFRGQSPQQAPDDRLLWRAPQVYQSPAQAQGQAPAAQPQYYQPPAAPYQQVAAAPPASPYQNVRGQSPTSPGPGNVIQAYSAVPAGQTAASPYGGQIVGATGPASAPVGGVQPAQYSPQLQPPAGSVYPEPLSPLGPLPGYTVDPSLTYPPELLPTYPEDMVDVIMTGNETQTGRLMLGMGINSNAGVVGNIVVDERNFDWTQLPTSWEDVRTGRAFRGSGQRFRIDASPGSQVSRYLVSFQEPYLFDRPVSLGLSASFFDRRYRDWDEQRIGGRVSLGRQFVERDLTATISYRGENVNIHDVSDPSLPQLAEVVGDNVLHGFRLALINDTRDSAFLATQGHYFEVGGEQVIGTFDYPRVDLDFRQYWRLYERPDHSGRHVLSYSGTLGYTGTQTPIYENFFAGGFATLRGFDFRGASPVVNGVEVGGQFQWLNSLQYLFPITADDMLHGVAFVDFGTVEPDVKIENFRVAPGLGLRITVPAMGPAPIALDFAYAVSKAPFDDPEIFSFSLGFSR